MRAAALTFAVFAGALCARPAAALEFRSVGSPAAILYDAPSNKAHKLYILGKGYPVEILVTLEGWFKVRDATGELAWVDAADLVPTRMLMVRVPRADVRQAPEEGAPVLFQAEQDVLLELLEPAGAFVRVRHSDGAMGYIRIGEVWGL